jgi:hypothetical protein
LFVADFSGESSANQHGFKLERHMLFISSEKNSRNLGTSAAVIGFNWL